MSSCRSLDGRIVLLYALPRERQERDTHCSLPGPCRPHLFGCRAEVDLASPLAALKGTSAQKRGCLWSGQDTASPHPASRMPAFKGPWKLSNPIGRLKYHCLGHPHLQNILGVWVWLLTFKSPRDSKIGHGLLHFLHSDGRWHLSVNLCKMSCHGSD